MVQPGSGDLDSSPFRIPPASHPGSPEVMPSIPSVEFPSKFVSAIRSDHPKSFMQEGFAAHAQKSLLP
jgi:hypothetical protein